MTPEQAHERFESMRCGEATVGDDGATLVDRVPINESLDALRAFGALAIETGATLTMWPRDEETVELRLEVGRAERCAGLTAGGA